MTKKSIFRDQFSWKVRTFSHARSYFRSKAQRKTRFPLVLCSLIRNFAQNLCENGLHLGKERASKLAVTIYLLGTRFAPSLSHAFSQRHHLLLLNFSDEPRPLTRFYEQAKCTLELRATAQTSNHSTFGAVAGLSENMGRGLRFLYAHTDSAPPTRL